MSIEYVKGMPALTRVFNGLPQQLAAFVLPGAMRAAANPIAAEARRLAPIGQPSTENIKKYGDYPGALRDSIRVSVKVKDGRAIATIRAGGHGQTADVFYAHLIEYSGAAAHRIKAHKGKDLKIGSV